MYPSCSKRQIISWACLMKSAITSFNMRLINSLADAEACANALADVFYEALMDQLIRENKPFAKPPEAKTPTLK